MKRLLLLFAGMLMGTQVLLAQLTVNLTNPTNTTPNMQASYTSFAAALTDLNLVSAMSGPITLTLQAGSETAPVKGFVIGSASLNGAVSAVNTVTINTSGGTVTINAGVGTSAGPSAFPDGMLVLNGADYITIDGITFTDGNATNATESMEFGIGLFKLSAGDGCNNNTIQNCTFNMQRLNNASGSTPLVDGSVGIGIYNSTYTAATTALTPTNGGTLYTNGTNSENNIYSNSFNGGNYGIVIIGFAATVGVGPNPDINTFLGDVNNDIGGSSAPTGNSILNFGGGAGATNPSAGIRVNSQWGINISYNTVNNNNGTGVNHVSTLRGIYAQTATSAAATINNNSVTIKGGGTSSQVAAIESGLGATPNGNTVSISNNTVTGEYLTATSGVFYGIYSISATPATLNIQNNSVNGWNYSASGLTGSGAVYPIYTTGSNAGTTINATGNTVNNITRTGTTGGTTIGIFLSAGTTGMVVNANNNTITNMSIDGTGTSSTMYGMQTSTGTISMNNNQINSLSCIKTTGTGTLYGIYNGASPVDENYNNNTVHTLTHNGTGTVYGIYVWSTTGTRTMSGNLVYNLSTGGTTIAGLHNISSSPVIYNNKIYNITSTSTGAPTVSGILQGSLGTAGFANIYNNFIGDLKAPAANTSSATSPSVRGINITTTTASSNVRLFYNTVFLNASTTGTNFGTAAMYATTSTTATTANLTLKNNIFINNSTPAGTGLAVAYQRSSTALDNYDNSSNYNLFYAGTPGASNLIFYDGTNTDQTMAAFKTRVSPRESASISENPNFLSTAGGSPNFLHINPAVPTQIESGGMPIAGITDDYDGDVRSLTTPDIGADEFAGIPVDLSAPVIAYVPFDNTASTTPRVLEATITDASGVPTSGIGLPVLYWNVNGGAYTAVTAAWVSVNDYTFTFGGGVTTGDVVGYYVVAQDQAVPANIGANPSGGASGYTANPPAVSTPPVPPNTYTIVQGLGGLVTVGTGGTYPSLTGVGGLFADINGKVVTSNITAHVLSNLTETGLNALNQWAEDGAGNYTVTIKPGPSVNPLISGDFNGGLIRLNGADRVIIDGSNAGTTSRNMTIQNNSTLTNSAVIAVQSLGSNMGATDNTIKNCIIIGGEIGTTTSIQTFGIHVAGTTISNSATGPDNDNLTIQNNIIKKARYGIYARSTAVLNANDNLLITQNEIGSTNPAEYVTFRGIDITNAQNAEVSRNYIFNMKQALSASNAGIDIGAGVNGSVINANRIEGVYSESTSGYGAYGINFSSSTSVDNNFVTNNIINDIRAVNYSTGSTTFNAFGIRLVGGTNTRIYHNTVNLFGDITIVSGSPSQPNSAALIVTSTSVTGLHVVNNILVNTNTFFSGTPKTYSIWVPASFSGFATINHNDYYGIAGAPTTYYVGRQGSTDYTALADWQLYTGQDGSSKNVDPLFVNPVSDLTPANAALDNTGMFLVDVPYDFNNVLRTNPPDIGAIEFGNNPTITTGVAGLDCLDATLNGVANANGLVVDLFFDYGLTTGFGSVVNAAPAQVTGNTDTDVTAGLAGLTANTTYYYRLRGVTTGGLTVFGETQSFTTGTLSAPTATTLAASPIGNTTATMNGTVNAGCDATTVTFEWGETLAYGNVIAASQSPVSGGNDVAVSADLIGLQINTTYNYRVVATNTQGTTYGANVSFQTGASPPTVVTNAATNIGNFAARLNSTVNANNQTTTTSFEWGATPAYGNVIAGVPLTVDGNTNQAVYADISGLNYNTMYYFRAVGQNTAGTTYGDQLTFMTLCPTPEPAGTIAGPTSVCQATDGHVYTVPAILYATGYDWTLPAGGTIVAGANTNSITVSYDATAVSGNVTVQGTNVCGSGTASSLAVTINPIPVPTITGDDMVCLNDTESYATQTGMTGYVWTVSAGGQILSGQGTSQVSVKWNNMGAQHLTVTYTNASGCPAASPTMYDVEVSNNPSPTIAGNDVACQLSDENHVFTTEEGFNAYVWTVSSGGTIVSGQGTFQIEVYWTGSGMQTVTVNYENASGCSAATPASFEVEILPVPGNGGTISGTDMVCVPADNLVYSVDPIANAEMYYWTVPFGVTIVDGIGTNSITVNFAADAEAGAFSVFATNGCGEGLPSADYAVMVAPTPEKPVVTLEEYDLTSSAAEGNQWYFEGEAIEGATGQTYTATETGNYWTVVTLDGCSSEASEPVYVLITGLNENADGRFTIHPVPNDGQFTVTLRSVREVTWDVTVYNNLGVEVYQIRDLRVNGTVSEQITLQNPARGTYTVVFSNNQERIIRKVLVSN